MPNWAQNRLTVENPTEEFINLFKDGLSFEAIIPHPSDLDPDTMAGYTWRVDNWGTKWDVWTDGYAPVFDDQNEMEFETPWNPPIPIIYELVNMFPTMKFTLRYFEGGNMFGGIVEAFDGIVDNDEEYCDEELIKFAEEHFGYVDSDYDDLSDIINDDLDEDDEDEEEDEESDLD
jgi:hypothetical protein